MLSRFFALTAVFAVAHAGLQAGHDSGHENNASPEDHPSYSPETNHHPLPEVLAKHLRPANSSYSIPSVSSTKAASTTHPTTAPSSGFSSQPSSGYPSYTNSSSVPVTLGPSYTTKIITETITDCPVTVTKGHGAEATTSVYYTTSTKTITSTITVCTKCVEAPKTTEVSPQQNSPENSPQEQQDSHTLTYTVGSGESTSVVTTTVKNTKTKTNTHTVYATESPGASPETAEKCNEGEECITQTSKIYRTSTRYITAAETCPPQVTVTVPGPDVTVTVTSMEGPPKSSFVPPFPSSYGNSTLPGTSTSASTGFLTKTHPTYNPSPSSNLFPSASAHAEAKADAKADAKAEPPKVESKADAKAESKVDPSEIDDALEELLE